MPTLAIDLDGVLTRNPGWETRTAIDDPIPDPLPGAVEFVKSAVKMGYKVVVYSETRHPAVVNDWLIRHGLGDIVTTSVGRPDATVCLDDRGLRFEGDFGPILDFLKGDPRPWWRKA